MSDLGAEWPGALADVPASAQTIRGTLSVTCSMSTRPPCLNHRPDEVREISIGRHLLENRAKRRAWPDLRSPPSVD